MRRRKFLGRVGGAVAWPLAARAQQDSRVRRIGWLTAGAENDLGPQADRAVLLEALSKLGWVEGRNLRIDLRFGVDDSSRLRRYAAELVGLAPDLILTYSGAATQAVKEADHSDHLCCSRRPRGERLGAKHRTARGQYYRI
jgi:putative ABC transport system substrate-binding protein